MQKLPLVYASRILIECDRVQVINFTGYRKFFLFSGMGSRLNDHQKESERSFYIEKKDERINKDVSSERLDLGDYSYTLSFYSRWV